MNKIPVDINAEFAKALDLMERSDRHVFITGRAGTGKSTLLDLFRRTTRKEVAVLAPTGVAALNVQGQTIHSFFNFKPRARSRTFSNARTFPGQSQETNLFLSRRRPYACSNSRAYRPGTNS
jgi:predicted ATPase